MTRQDIINKIKENLIEAIRITGNKAFNLSQQRCPVITGKLKNSGSGKDIDHGFELKYDCEYAEYPERGAPPGMRHVPTYRKRSGIIVKAYSYFSSGQKSQRYIGKSMDEAFSQDFARNFDNKLRSSGIKVFRT